MTIYGPAELLADYDLLDNIETRARELHAARWPDRTWEGGRTKRSYWRRMARKNAATCKSSLQVRLDAAEGALSDIMEWRTAPDIVANIVRAYRLGAPASDTQPGMKPGTGGMHPNPREGEAS